MSQRKRYIFTALFSGLCGFVLGVAVLFLVNVPVEAVLARYSVAQRTINVVMMLIILAWAGSVFLVTRVFYNKMLLRTERYKLSIWVLIILAASAAGLFSLLLTTNSNVLQVWRGSSQEESSKYTIGPYPEAAKLRELKQGGYKGVISLLNPTIPFEKVLLDREIKAGKNIGLPIHSFPMLPWVSSNQASLDKIKALVEKQEGPFYIHCYLGKHRVDLVEQYLSGANRNFLFPDYLERGKLYYFQNGRVILGPYPTDEEWFHLVRRGQVKEVISCLDTANSEDLPWIEKEKKLCTEAGLTFKLQPVQLEGNKVTGIAELMEEVNKSKGKVFIHTFLINDKTNLIENCLRAETTLVTVPSLPQVLSGGHIFPVNRGLVLGPEPNMAERNMLQASGYKVLYLPLKKTLFASAMATRVISDIDAGKGAYYVCGFYSEQSCKLTRQILQQRLYGISGDMEKVHGEQVNSFSRNLFVGLAPNDQELNSLAMEGIATIIYLPDDKGKQQDSLKSTAEHLGLNFRQVQYHSGNVNQIVNEVSRDNNPCYVAVDKKERYDVEQSLKAAKLFYRPEQN